MTAPPARPAAVLLLIALQEAHLSLLCLMPKEDGLNLKHQYQALALPRAPSVMTLLADLSQRYTTTHAYWPLPPQSCLAASHVYPSTLSTLSNLTLPQRMTSSLTED